MGNYIISLLALLWLAPPPTSEYNKPVHHPTHEEVSKQIYLEPIYVVELDTKGPWLHVGTHPPTYEELKYEAIYNCKNNKKFNQATERLIDSLIAIEKKYNVPQD